MKIDEKLSYTFPPNTALKTQHAIRKEVVELMGDDDMGDCRCSEIRVIVTHMSELNHWFDASVDCDCEVKRSAIRIERFRLVHRVERSMDHQTAILGILLVLMGGYIIAKTWTVPWDEAIRALVWHPRTMRGAHLKLLGLGLCVAGVVTILAGLGLI